MGVAAGEVEPVARSDDGEAGDQQPEAKSAKRSHLSAETGSNTHEGWVPLQICRTQRSKPDQEEEISAFEGNRASDLQMRISTSHKNHSNESNREDEERADLTSIRVASMRDPTNRRRQREREGGREEESEENGEQRSEKATRQTRGSKRYLWRSRSGLGAPKNAQNVHHSCPYSPPSVGCISYT